MDQEIPAVGLGIQYSGAVRFLFHFSGVHHGRLVGLASSQEPREFRKDTAFLERMDLRHGSFRSDMLFDLEMTVRHGIPDFLTAAGLTRMAAVLVTCLVVMAVSCVITLIQSKIPVLKRLVGF